MNSSTGYEKEGEANMHSPSTSQSGQSSGTIGSESESSTSLNLSSARALVTETTIFAQGFRLTPRETEIVVVLAEGITRIKDIADRLKLSPNTVNNHVNSIFMKTKARSKSQLLAMLLGRISLELQSARIFRQRPRVAILTTSDRLRIPLTAAFDESNFTVEIFGSQSAFLSALSGLQPHFVVADLSVAELDPEILLNAICKEGTVTAVFVGASKMISTRCQAMEAGAMDLFDVATEPQRVVNMLLAHYIENDADRARFMSFSHVSTSEPIEAKEVIKVSQSTLGKGGIFLSAAEVERGFAKPLLEGDRVELRLAIEGIERPFRAQGEVVWVRADGLPKTAGAGVRLLNLIDVSDTERDSFRNYVRRNSTKSYIPSGVLDPA